MDRVSEYEIRTLADRMLLMSRDISEEYRDAGYLPTMKLIHSSHQAFQEMVDQLQKLLIDPDMLPKIAVEWKTFADAYTQNPDILRFRFYRPKEISNQLQDLQREPVTFIAAEDYTPQRHFYISGDEIDKVLRGSSAEYRLSVYAFFANHSDQKEREKFLKEYHGEYSGYHGGNDNRLYTGKGLSFSHGDLTQPYAKVELKWNFIVKRIDSMIAQDRFLSEKDREAMAGYEIKQLARSIHRFFIDAPEMYPRPYQANAIADYWEGVQEVAEQLVNPTRVEEIYQMNFPIFYRGTNPCTSKGRCEINQCQLPIQIDGVTIEPGDYIFGDIDGIAVIPKDVVDEVIDRSIETVKKEDEVREMLQNGASMTEAYHKNGAI